MGLSYACLFLGYTEQCFFCCYTGSIPQLFLCYIDDCIGPASRSHEELEQFVNFTNFFHSNLKFTWIISDTSLPFLVHPVSIFSNHLNTDIYFKPTDSRSYLDYTTSPLPSCKNTVAYAQFLRSAESAPKMEYSTPGHSRCPPT
eukprot:g41454.t1